MKDSPLDMETVDALRELQMDDEPDILGELIDLFAADSPGLISTMHTAIAAGDASTLRRAAHTLKGSSANLGATALSAICKTLEDLAKAESLSGADDLVTQIE